MECRKLERAYTGVPGEVRQVRADLALFAAGFPAADSLVLLVSELVTNAILRTRSGSPGRSFTVRAALSPGECARVEVIDQGGHWAGNDDCDEHGRGLDIVAAIAGDGNWGITGNAASRTAWFRLGWQPDPA